MPFGQRLKSSQIGALPHVEGREKGRNTLNEITEGQSADWENKVPFEWSEKMKQTLDWKKISVQELMQLPLAQRRQIMRRQTEAARIYYLSNPNVKGLGGGDFIDY